MTEKITFHIEVFDKFYDDDLLNLALICMDMIMGFRLDLT